MTRLFGQIYEPLTARSGVEWWISSLGATPASPSQWPVASVERRILDTSGLTLSGSSRKSNPLLFSSKTCPIICPSEDTRSSEAYTNWATRLRQHCLKRKKWERRINASASSSLVWRTPDCPTSRGGAVTPESRRAGGHSVNLQDQAANWPTPIVGDAHLSSNPDAAQRRMDEGKLTLSRLVESGNWPSPRVEDSECCGNHPGKQDSLNAAAQLWPTPDAGVSQDGEGVATWERRRAAMREKGYNGNGCGTPLAMAAQLWPSPNTRDGNSAARKTTTTGVMHDGDSLTDAIRAFPLSLQPETTSTCGEKSSPSIKKLNPLFVEWLMGWKRGWTAFDS